MSPLGLPEVSVRDGSMESPVICRADAAAGFSRVQGSRSLQQELTAADQYFVLMRDLLGWAGDTTTTAKTESIKSLAFLQGMQLFMLVSTEIIL